MLIVVLWPRPSLERQQQIDKAVRERELSDLRLKVQSHQIWQSGVQRAVRQTIAAQQRQALLTEMDAIVNPPPPPPEPERIVYVSQDEGSPDLGDRDFSVKAWMQKPRSWW